MTLRTALRTSSNRAAVRLLQQVGIDRTVAYAKQLGVGSVPSVPSLALGSGEVTLLSMTAAYGSFANHGILPQPTVIRRVEDKEGHVLFEAAPSARRVLSETTAFLMTSMLADVINYGTAYKARAAGFTLPAAGKTGTTNDYLDAWFVGFTPNLVTGVWMGFDQPQTIVARGYAGDIAVPIWGRFMKEATRGDKPEWFSPPKGIVSVNVCRISGKLPNEGCGAVEVLNRDGEVETRSMIYTEYFARGQQPVDVCPLHPGESLLGHIAGWFGKEGSRPSPVENLGLPPTADPTPTTTSGTIPTATADGRDRSVSAAPSPKKKRGFWSRVFGVGKDDEHKDRDSQKRKGDQEPQQ
jgi:membrane carboxypeptidase/penicillin-binding protein